MLYIPGPAGFPILLSMIKKSDFKLHRATQVVTMALIVCGIVVFVTIVYLLVAGIVLVKSS